jgi:hypothetical protein
MGFRHIFAPFAHQKSKVVLKKKMPPEFKRQTRQVDCKVPRIEESESSESDLDDEPDWATVMSRSIFKEPPRSSAMVDHQAFLAYKKKRFCSQDYAKMCWVYDRVWNGTLDHDDLLYLQKLGFVKKTE